MTKPSMPESVEGQTWPRALVAAAVFVLCLAQVFCAFYGSDRSFWLDEAFSAEVAAQPLGEIPEVIKEDTAPPGYYLALAAWVRIFGTSERAVRSLSALFFVAAGLVIFFAARSLFSTRVALLCLSIYTASPLAILTAQLGRMYAMLILLSAASTFLFVRIFFSEDKPRWAEILFVVVSALGLLTHLWFFFLFSSEALCWALFSRFKQPMRAVVLFAAPFVIYALLWLPSFYQQYRFAGGGLAWAWRPTLIDLGEVPYWHARIFVLVALVLVFVAWAKLKDRLKDQRPVVIIVAALTLVLFAGPELRRVLASVSRPEVIKYRELVALATVVALILAFIARDKLKDRRIAILASLYALTLLVPFAVSMFKPLFFARYTVVALPAVVFLLGLILDSIYTRLVPLFCAAMVAVTVYGVAQYINGLPPCDDRATALYLSQHARPGDVVIFSGMGRLPVEYYLKRFNPNGVPTIHSYPESLRAPVLPVPFQVSAAADARRLVERVKGEAPPGAQVWLFYGGWQPWHPYHDVIKQELEAHYDLVENQPMWCVLNNWSVTLYSEFAVYK